MSKGDNADRHDAANASLGAQRLTGLVPLSEQDWADTRRPLVSICCITYGHEAFIRQCLDGFLMQKTSFPVEVLIHDDASTDRTAQIIREYESRYPKIIKPIYQTENQYAKKIKPNQTFNYPRALGTYIANCEGDDYWTDPLKLSKQVAFLESHKDHALCWTRFQTLSKDAGEIAIDGNGRYFTPGCDGIPFTFETFLEGWHIGMPTFMFRKHTLSLSRNLGNEYYRDVFLISDLLSFGKGYCLNDVTAVYRIHKGGIYSGVGQGKRAETGASIYREIFMCYPDNPYLKEKYHRFNRRYVQFLLRDKRHLDALQAIEQELDLTIAEDERREAFVRYMQELLEQIGQQVEGGRRQHQDLKNSWSYRTGHLFVSPVRLVARLYKKSLAAIAGKKTKLAAIRAQDKR